MGSRMTTSMSLAVLELLLDEHAVKEPDGRRHGPVLAVVLLELGTTHHAKGLDRSGRGAAPTRPLYSCATADRVPREAVSTARAARATVFAASHDGLRIGQPRGSLRAWRRRKTQRFRPPRGAAARRGSPALALRRSKLHQDAEATTNFEENLATLSPRLTPTPLG